MANVENVALPKGTRLIFGKNTYTIERVLGAGGFGITYYATSAGNGQPSPYAIKELFVKRLCDRDRHTAEVTYSDRDSEEVQSCLEDFVAEAMRLQENNLHHENLVKIHSVFQANRTAYYIMEYIDGVSLRQLVQKDKHSPRDGHPLPEEKALSIFTPVLNAVAKLHNARITHLDIKPDNIQLGRTDEPGRYRPVLIDFGLSKHYDKNGNATSTLRNIGCSDGYSPLEQYSGLERFSPTADIYSLGATLYFVLTGQRPEKASEIKWVLAEQALKKNNVSQQVCDAIKHAMAKIPEDRTQSVEEFARELGVQLGKEENNETTVIIKGKSISGTNSHPFTDGAGRTLSLIKKYLIPALIGIIFAAAAYFIFRKTGPSEQPAGNENQTVLTSPADQEDVTSAPEGNNIYEGETKENPRQASVASDGGKTPAPAPAVKEEKPKQKPAVTTPEATTQNQAYEKAMKSLHDGDIEGARRAAAAASPEERNRIEQEIRRSGAED